MRIKIKLEYEVNINEIRWDLEDHGVRLTPTQIKRIIEKNHESIGLELYSSLRRLKEFGILKEIRSGKGNDYGRNVSYCRDSLLDAVVKLVGMRGQWPRYGDSDKDTKRFVRQFKRKAKEKRVKLTKDFEEDCFI